MLYLFNQKRKRSGSISCSCFFSFHLPLFFCPFLFLFANHVWIYITDDYRTMSPTWAWRGAAVSTDCRFSWFGVTTVEEGYLYVVLPLVDRHIHRGCGDRAHHCGGERQKRLFNIQHIVEFSCWTVAPRCTQQKCHFEGISYQCLGSNLGVSL